MAGHPGIPESCVFSTFCKGKRIKGSCYLQLQQYLMMIDQILWVRLRSKLLSRTLSVSQISTKIAETLLGIFKKGFNMWIYLYKCWKPEHKKDAEVCKFLITTLLTLILNCFPTPLLMRNVWGFFPHTSQFSQLSRHQSYNSFQY